VGPQQAANHEKRPSRWRPGGPRDYPGDDSNSTGRVNDRIGLATQIAADLLPEAGDSGAVEAEEDL
jgi:hypothetical protein